MKKKHWKIAIFAGFVLVVIFTLSGGFNIKGKPEGTDVVKAATVYKTPTCGCCGVYTQYLRKEGIAVDAIDVPSLAEIKNENGIPRDLESCHTSLVGDYVVEGHVPLQVIEKLVTEQPDIKGIALPGMPSGSPGMPGPKLGAWTIYAIGHDGAVSEFMQY